MTNLDAIKAELRDYLSSMQDDERNEAVENLIDIIQEIADETSAAQTDQEE